MTLDLAGSVADRVFRDARSYNCWQDEPVAEETLRDLYGWIKWGPTSANSGPLRILFLRSPDSRERAAPFMLGNNAGKVRAAPVVAILGYDTQFFELLPTLFPHEPAWQSIMAENAVLAHETAFRNSSMQAGYFIIAARMLGLDCGPMSGFDAEGINAEFFPDGRIVANLMCALGRGDPTRAFYERLPRLAFEQACSII